MEVVSGRQPSQIRAEHHTRQRKRTMIELDRHVSRAGVNIREGALKMIVGEGEHEYDLNTRCHCHH